MRADAALGFRLELSPLFDAETVLLVDDREAEAGERDGLAQQGVCPDDDRRLPRGDQVVRVRPVARIQRAGQQQHIHADTLEQRPDGVPVLPGQQVGRREQRTLEAGLGRGGQRIRSDRRLARAHVALEQPEHGRRTGKVGTDRVDGRRLVRGQLDRPADLSRQRDHQRGTDRLVGRVVDGDGRRSVGAAGAPPGDHAELEREQLVEGQPPQRRVPPFE